MLLAEIVLRVIGFSDPVFWTYDDVTGSKLYAGAQGWYRAEGEAFITINNEGLRDREHSKAKPPNTVRIAVLGDSMVEALQMPLENTFWAVFERLLKNCRTFGGGDVEVINFGAAGYGTAQELLTFRRRAASYSPDITILAFYAGNDVRNNSKELELSKLRPFFSIQNGDLILDDSFLGNPEYQSFKSQFDVRKRFFGLRTYQLMRKLKSVSEQWRAAGQRGTAQNANIEPGLDDHVFLAPTIQAWKDAWQITERLILALRDEVVARGGRFLVVSIPIGIQVHPIPEVRNRFMRELRIDDLWYPETRLRELGHREKLDVMTLSPTLQSHAESNQQYLHGFKNTRLGTGHLNYNGHKLLGEAIANHLCRSQ